MVDIAAPLPSYPFQIAYSGSDDPLHTFYIPALERSTRVIRGTGFYSSSSLAVAAAGVSRLVHNDGTMEIFCGAQISEEDVEAIRQGESIQNRLGASMSGVLDFDLDAYKERRLEVLAWLISKGRLSFHVVLPLGQDGFPLPASESQEYYHPKQGLFFDSDGNSMCFSGSVNESATGWTQNYESFLVHTSWDRPETPAGRAYIKNVQQEFDALRSGSKPDWIILPIPDAAVQNLLKFCPNSRPPAVDPFERVKPVVCGRASTDSLTAIQLAFLRDAPKMPGTQWMGAETCTVAPWPHQRKAYLKAVEEYPRNYLFCDEVGLGKTIEVGLVLRQLVISERVKRFLILVPRAVQRQWQEELWEKFSLNVPVLSDGEVTDYFGNRLEWDREIGPWDSFQWLLATSHLAKRSERREEVIASKRWDLVIVDEAHHARRKDFLDTTKYRPNSLLTLLLGDGEHGGLVERTNCIYLMTATPMQINPVEVWDLLRVLGMGGLWGARKENFLQFFSQLARPFGERDWDFLLRMTRDSIEAGFGPDEAVALHAEKDIGPVAWESMKHLVHDRSRVHEIRNLKPYEAAFLEKFVRSATPLRGLIFRNTRNLLHEYRRKGLLDQVVPHRQPENVWIRMFDTLECPEKELYERIEHYISHYYKKYEEKRKGLGFVMTVYRKRLTSSFYALERSLTRRLDSLRDRLSPSDMFDDEDLETEELDLDVDEEFDLEGAEEEIEYIEDFLKDLAMLPQDSKLDVLLLQIDDFLSLRESVLVFTQYTDTMDFLRDKLRQKFGRRVACYSGRGGEIWTGTEWQIVPKESIKNLFREGQEISILLCTESASEGLNLQTCGALINYDMPWNPMRVEQRIGRIDRIGQRYETVWVRNFFFEDTVEARVYQKLDERISSFTNVIGRLQPILYDVANIIRDASMVVDSERERILFTQLASLQKKLDDEALKEFDLDALVDTSTESGTVAGIPAGLSELEAILTTGTIPGVQFEPGNRDGVWTLYVEEDEVSITFRPDLFDEFPNSLQLLTWGNPLLDTILCKASDGDEKSRKGFLSIKAADLVTWYIENRSRLLNVTDISLENTTKTWNEDEISSALVDFEQIVDRNQKARISVVESSSVWKQKAMEIEAQTLLRNAVTMQCVANCQQSFSMKHITTGDLVKAENDLLLSGFPWKPLRNVIAGQLTQEDFRAILEEANRIVETRRPVGIELDRLRSKAESLVQIYSGLQNSINRQESSTGAKSLSPRLSVNYYH